MPRPLPDNWSNLSVSDLGIRGAYPNNLKIKRVSRSDALYASWLPEVEDDTRPNQGRSGKTNKRVPIERSMRTSDAYEAGKRAVLWVQDLQRAQKEQREAQEQVKESCLGIYCCLLYTSPSPRDQRGSRMPSSA